MLHKTPDEKTHGFIEFLRKKYISNSCKYFSENFFLKTAKLFKIGPLKIGNLKNEKKWIFLCEAMKRGKQKINKEFGLYEKNYSGIRLSILCITSLESDRKIPSLGIYKKPIFSTWAALRRRKLRICNFLNYAFKLSLRIILIYIVFFQIYKKRDSEAFN